MVSGNYENHRGSALCGSERGRLRHSNWSEAVGERSVILPSFDHRQNEAAGISSSARA